MMWKVSLGGTIAVGLMAAIASGLALKYYGEKVSLDTELAIAKQKLAYAEGMAKKDSEVCRLGGQAVVDVIQEDYRIDEEVSDRLERARSSPKVDGEEDEINSTTRLSDDLIRLLKEAYCSTRDKGNCSTSSPTPSPLPSE